MCESMDKNRIQGASAGRAGNLPRSPYPSRVRSVDSAAAHRRRLSLPQEICSGAPPRQRLSKGGLTAGQKSAEGILGHDVGKASEALHMPKGGAMDRPSRERWLKARTRRPRRSRHPNQILSSSPNLKHRVASQTWTGAILNLNRASLSLRKSPRQGKARGCRAKGRFNRSRNRARRNRERKPSKNRSGTRAGWKRKRNRNHNRARKTRQRKCTKHRSGTRARWKRKRNRSRNRARRNRERKPSKNRSECRNRPPNKSRPRVKKAQRNSSKKTVSRKATKDEKQKLFQNGKSANARTTERESHE